MDLTISEVQRAVAARIPDRECIVDCYRRLTYAEFDSRAGHLADYFSMVGLGRTRARPLLRPWESGQQHIGLYMHNCPEYLECEFAAARARAVAININWRYVDKELLYLFRNAALTGIVYHSVFANQLSGLRGQLEDLQTWIQVPDESGSPLLPGAVWYEDAVNANCGSIEAPIPSPDDLHVLYTGGTTGFPKGVLWRQADILMAGLGGQRPGGQENTIEDFVRKAEKTHSRTLPAGPFMHASGRWSSMGQILLGNTVVLPGNTRRFDPDDIWTTAEREKVTGINIAGDAFARPLVAQLEKKSYDLKSLRMITSGAATLSATVKRELLTWLPGIAISDTIGASETGPQASSVSRSGEPIENPRFTLTSTTTVLRSDRSGKVPTDSTEIGWLARSGRVPLGYLGDAERTQSTFPVIDGIRYVVPGDRARWSGQDQIELLGRDAATINSGGEKIFAEEVEVAIKQHAAVFDAVVCGRPHDRWGQEVVAVVSIRSGMPLTEADLLTECAKHIARYKLPKEFIFMDAIRRSDSGKPDYEWARAQVHRSSTKRGESNEQ